MNDTEKIHTWSFYSQFNALTSYSILIAVIVICVLFGFLLFGVKVDFANYYWVKTPDLSSILLFLKLCIVCVSRFIVVYFLMDFFIICIYAVISLFHFTNRDMLDKKSNKQITRSKDINEELKEFGVWPIIIKTVLILIICLVIAFLII